MRTNILILFLAVTLRGAGALLLWGSSTVSAQVTYELACPAGSQPVDAGAGVSFNSSTGKYRANLYMDGNGIITKNFPAFLLILRAVPGACSPKGETNAGRHERGATRRKREQRADDSHDSRLIRRVALRSCLPLGISCMSGFSARPPVRM